MLEKVVVLRDEFSVNKIVLASFLMSIEHCNTDNTYHRSNSDLLVLTLHHSQTKRVSQLAKECSL